MACFLLWTMLQISHWNAMFFVFLGFGFHNYEALSKFSRQHLLTFPNTLNEVCLKYSWPVHVMLSILLSVFPWIVSDKSVFCLSGFVWRSLVSCHHVHVQSQSLWPAVVPWSLTHRESIILLPFTTCPYVRGEFGNTLVLTPASEKHHSLHNELLWVYSQSYHPH